MANIVEIGLSIAGANFVRINDFSSNFDFSVFQFIKIFKKYFPRYRYESIREPEKTISDNEPRTILAAADTFIYALRAFTSDTITYYDAILKFGRKMFQLAKEIDEDMENANGDSLVIYQALKKYNNFVLIHNSVITKLNAFKYDFKHDIIRKLNQFINEFGYFNIETHNYSLRTNLILQTLENFRRRLNLISQKLSLSFIEPVNDSIFDELEDTINSSYS